MIKAQAAESFEWIAILQSLQTFSEEKVVLSRTKNNLV